MVGPACTGSSTPPIPTPPDLGAAADGRPGVHHGAAVDVCTDVHVARHQHDVGCDIGPAPHDGVRDDAHAVGGKLLFVVIRVLERHLVVETGMTALDHLVVLQAERQQHRLLQPLVHVPVAIDFLGDPGLARVEHGDCRVHRVRQLVAFAVAVRFAASLEAAFDNVNEFRHTGIRFPKA
jgi:hypothetical protein